MPEQVAPINVKIVQCRSCSARVFWAATPNGKKCPFDADPAPDGYYVVAATNVKGVDFPNELCMAKYDADEDVVAFRYHSHFRTCPQAGEHSKRGK